MPKLGGAYVNIRANLAPLKTGLALARTTVLGAMKGIASVAKSLAGSIVGGITSVISGIVHTAMAIVEKIYALAKKAALVFAAATTYATYAAMKQEAAAVKLATALKMAGTYTDEVMKKMVKYSNQLQNTTTYSDDAVLSLMQLAVSMGQTPEQAAAATKAAIGLARAYGTSADSMLRGVLLADEGATLLLSKWIPALKSAKTEAEKMRIIQEAANKGFGIELEYATKTGMGALAQIKNVISDVAESYGGYMIPAIIKMRDWMIENKLVMMEWAERAADAVLLVKDVLWDLAKYTYSDFPEAMKAAWDAIKIGFTALAETIKTIWRGMLADIKYLTNVELRDLMGTIAGFLAGIKATPGAWWKYSKIGAALKIAEAEIVGKREWGKTHPEMAKPSSILPDIAVIWKKAGVDIWKTLPEELQKPLREAYSKWLEQEKAIKEKYEKLRAEKEEVIGEFGAPKLEKAVAKIGFVGIAEAWQAMIRGLQPGIDKLQLDTAKQHLDVAKKSDKKLEVIMKCLPYAGTVG